MKRWKSKVLLILAILLAMFLSAGCTRGKYPGEDKLPGVGGLTKAEEESGGQEAGDLIETRSLPAYTEDGIRFSFQADNKKLQVYTENAGWQDIMPVGVNVGAGKPGCFPGEFGITKEEYLRWFGQIQAMHADVIRVYTILMPEFYEALAEYNATAEKPLYFIQGVYNNEQDMVELADAYAQDGKIYNDWLAMCRTIVDIVHGNSTIEQVAGNAYGVYDDDVSQYLLGWILGIEWQPDFVINTNEGHPDKTEFDGEYLYVEEASPFEAFLAAGLDACISHETEQYKMQHPTAFANWVTTDPLAHPGEPNPEMEDAVSVDAEHVKAKPAFRAGLFASYHVYPYYPEMMRYAPELLEDDPPNSYKSYLNKLVDYHTMPVVISEFGVPSSRGVTHLAREAAFNQGGLTEEAQGNALVSMLRDISDTGCAGACMFIWQDEWFKRTWNTMDYTDAESRAYWCDVQTSEQFFGLLSFDPGEEAVCTVDGKAGEWDNMEPLVKSGEKELYVKSDEAYVYLLLKGGGKQTRITLDTIPEQGNSQYDGADFSVELNGKKNSRVLVDPYYDVNYWLYTTGTYSTSKVLEVQEGYADKNSSRFEPINLMLNRPVVLTDGTQVGTEQIETGKLRHGNANPQSNKYNSRADFCIKGDITEIRLPWLLLNIPAPNRKLRIADLYAHDEITFEPISGIIFAVDGVSGVYSWDEWELPTYRERLKQSYYIVQEYLAKQQTAKGGE